MKTGERTVMQTAEFIAEATGLDTSHLRTVSRRLREADLLSQGGRGLGAAAATPEDAALLLLVSILGVPSLHAVRIGEAVLACTDGWLHDEDAEHEHVEVGGSAVDHVAGLIAAGGDTAGIHIVLRGDDLRVNITNAGESFYYRYSMPARSPYRRKLAAKFGRLGKVGRRGDIFDGVLPEISEFLGLNAEDAA